MRRGTHRIFVYGLWQARVAVIKHNKKLRTVQAMEKASDDEDEDEQADDKREDRKDDSKDEHEDDGNESEDEQEEKGIADTLDVSDDEGDEERYRDQGFTRPRLLILCPMRKAALTVTALLLVNLLLVVSSLRDSCQVPCWFSIDLLLRSSSNCWRRSGR